MRTVGLLLVSALMVVPVATAQQLTRSFRATVAAATLLGTLASVGGLATAAIASTYGVNAATGPTIVLLALAGFVVAWPVGIWTRRRARLREPFPTVDRGSTRLPTNTHTNTDRKCGHLAVSHDDHVDYVHDGHRHAEHDGHYDEH